MFTIKQLEALYWVGTLGSFESAASYLNLAQSTVSKRIAELEQSFTVPLFDRTGRNSVLTAKGDEIKELAEQMLRLSDQLAQSTKASAALPRRFRLGVTDLVAMSWLPELLDTIIRRHPEVELEPEVSLTADLLNRLTERAIDFAICPRVVEHPQFVSSPLRAIELAWMCSPSLLDRDDAITTEELLTMPLLTQSRGSILRPVLQGVVDNPRLPFARKLTCNNMAVLAELAAFGLGVTILPKAFFGRHLADRRLRIIKTAIQLPALEYYITYRNDYHSAFCTEIAETCQEICDFTTTWSADPSEKTGRDTSPNEHGSTGVG